MTEIFPEPIRNLPEADMPVRGVRAYLSQARTHQVIFMQFSEDSEMPEHAHAAQAGIVIEGRIDLVIDGEKRTYLKGDRYHIPGGVKHSGKIYAGYAQVAFFAEPDRYRPK
ncbi:MAG: cupin domain-containing protein [Syntrophales bacterium]|nr:cupin domain-containing protein [Syntrophales bacterium]